MRTKPSCRHGLAALGALAVLAFTPACTAQAPGPADPPWLVVCSDLEDGDATRLLLGLAADGRSVTRFELVTPDFLWRAPDQPETARFPAGHSDASPDLAGVLRFTALVDDEGELRLLDFAAPLPDAVEFEGLRGSLALHEAWQGDRALGSLFHAGTGNLSQVTPVQCRRFAEAAGSGQAVR